MATSAGLLETFTDRIRGLRHDLDRCTAQAFGAGDVQLATALHLARVAMEGVLVPIRALLELAVEERS